MPEDNINNPDSKQAMDPARWLEDYGNEMFRFAMKRLHNTEHAEDIIQETLLAALQSHTGYAGQSSEKTWLIGILKHKIVDFIRKHVRELPVEDIQLLSDINSDNDINTLFDARGHWVRPPQDWGNPDKMLQNDQFMGLFKQCLDRLKPTHAQIFSLKELDGIPIEEICNQLAITATNCSVMLYRARMGLRRCLEVFFASENPEEIY